MLPLFNLYTYALEQAEGTAVAPAEHAKAGRATATQRQERKTPDVSGRAARSHDDADDKHEEERESETCRFVTA